MAVLFLSESIHLPEKTIPSPSVSSSSPVDSRAGYSEAHAVQLPALEPLGSTVPFKAQPGFVVEFYGQGIKTFCKYSENDEEEIPIRGRCTRPESVLSQSARDVTGKPNNTVKFAFVPR